MSLADELAASPRPQRVHKERTHPKGWEPGVVFDGTKGTLTTEPLEAAPDWDDLLRIWNLDPARYRVVEPVQFRAWDAPTGEGNVQRLYYYRATVETRPLVENDIDYLALLAEMRRWKAPKRTAPTGTSTFVACLADWQVGKGDGDGVEGTVARLMAMIPAVRERYRELRRIGRTFDRLVIAGLGDPVEQCFGHYPSQTFTVQLNNREQATVVRRLLVQAIKAWAPDFERVTVLEVPSNHGQTRVNGKQVTGTGDDVGLAIAEQVHDIVRENPALNHVNFVIPRDEMVVVLDLSGTVVAFTHGHAAEKAGGPLPQAKLKAWWQGQAFGDMPAGDANVLVSGHYHHYSVIDHGPRLHIQCPSQDGGSKWWADATGANSAPGTVTFAAGHGRVADVQVV